MKYLFIISLFLFGCSPQKRMQRLLKKHPELISVVSFDTTIKDTIIDIDTFISKEYIDSFIFKTDTTYETDRVVVTKYRDIFHVKIKSDTTILKDSLFYEKVISVPGKALTTNYIPKWFWWLVVLVVGIGVWFYIGKTKDKERGITIINNEEK